MSHKIPLMVAAAVAALLLLTAVQAQGPHAPDQGPHYLVDVDTTIDAASATSADGTIDVCNISEDPLMTIKIHSVAVKLSYKEGGGDWTPFAEVTVSGFPTGDIYPDECVDDIPWQANYQREGANRIKIEAQVTVDERPDKVFIASDCADVV